MYNLIYPSEHSLSLSVYADTSPRPLVESIISLLQEFNGYWLSSISQWGLLSQTLNLQAYSNQRPFDRSMGITHLSNWQPILKALRSMVDILQWFRFMATIFFSHRCGA
jgi:hypothetical protein